MKTEVKCCDGRKYFESNQQRNKPKGELIDL